MNTFTETSLNKLSISLFFHFILRKWGLIFFLIVSFTLGLSSNNHHLHILHQ